MPITWLDLILLGVMLISGLLAMIRGFMREILSITAWGAAAVATLLLYPKLLRKRHLAGATVGVFGVVFRFQPSGLASRPCQPRKEFRCPAKTRLHKPRQYNSDS